MKVKDLEIGESVDRIEVEVKEIEEPRDWSNARGSGKVANAVVKDDTGEVDMTLWNEDIEKVNEEDTIIITNGWVSEFQDEKKLSTGRFGKMEVNPDE